MEQVGLTPTMFLPSLKQCVVELARNANVLPTVQRAAQAVLKTGWMVLLPTVPERASALLQLLPSAEGRELGGVGIRMNVGAPFLGDRIKSPIV